MRYCIALLFSCAASITMAAETINHLLIDLNKLEKSQQDCRISLVFENKTHFFYNTFYMDLAFFNKNGVISQRITVDAAPIRNKKITIKEFDVPQLSCNKIERVLLNSITQCELAKGKKTDCMDRIKIKSSSQIEFLM